MRSWEEKSGRPTVSSMSAGMLREKQFTKFHIDSVN